MKIEILYFPGCPNHAPAVERVREVLRQEAAHADLVEIAVTDMAVAQQLAFLGSPSIRVNGQDVEPTARAARAFGMMCRTYGVGGRRTGVPPSEWIRTALKEAGEKPL